MPFGLGGATTAGTVVMEVVPDASKFGAELKAGLLPVRPDLEKSGTALGQSFSNSFGTPLKGLAGAGGPFSKLSSLASSFGVSATLGFAVAGAAVVKFAADSVRSFQDHQIALQQLTTAFHNAPQIINESTRAFEDQATSIQNLTGFQDEEVLQADAVLARFGATRDQLKQLNPLVADYARTTGQDMTTAAESLGRALLGNARALKAVGINFKATGNRAADLRTIMGLLQDKVGGAAAAFGQTFAGKLEILKAQFDDLKEVIGEQLVGALISVISPITTLTSALDNLTISIHGVDISALKLILNLGTGLNHAAANAAGSTDAVTGAVLEANAQLNKFSESVKKSIDPMDRYHQAVRIAATEHISLREALATVDGILSENKQRLIDLIPATQKATDKWSGMTIQLYDADAALRAFNHSIDVYLGKIKAPGRNFTVTTPGAPIHKQHGGRIPGYGGGDIVPAMLEPGETVLTKEQTRAGTWGGPMELSDRSIQRLAAALRQTPIVMDRYQLNRAIRVGQIQETAG